MAENKEQATFSAAQLEPSEWLLKHPVFSLEMPPTNP
jgi:hypothetical protein